MVSRSASSIAPTASAHNADWMRTTASRMAADASTASPSGSAGDVVQVDLCAALAVERAVRVPGDGLAVDQEQPDAAVGQAPR